jgi:hypothetical protein
VTDFVHAYRYARIHWENCIDLTSVSDHVYWYHVLQLSRRTKGFDMTMTDEIKAGIEAGDIATVQDEVKVSDKASPTGKAASRPYTKLQALTAKGMALLCGGKLVPATGKPEDGVEDTRTDEQKAPGACDYFNYGYDLDVRAKERNILMSELEGPEKAIKKAVDSLVANAGMDETEARAFVIAQRTKSGKPV